MKTEYSRYKELVRKIIPGKMAGSKRGQSALSVFLIVLLIVAMAVGVGMIYKVYNQKSSVKRGSSLSKKSSGRKTSGRKIPGSSGGSDINENKVSAEYDAAIASYKVLLSKNITRTTGTGFDVSMDSRVGSESGAGSGSSAGSGSDTSSGSGSDTGAGSASGTGNGAVSSSDGTGAGSDIASGYDTGSTNNTSGAGTDSVSGIDSANDTAGSSASSESDTARSLDAEVWKPVNCEFALVWIDSDDIPELLVYNKKDAYHITGYGELYNYDKTSPTHVKAVMALSLDDLAGLGYYRKTGWYMDHYASAGSGKVSLKNIRESGKNQTVISKVLQSGGSDRYEVAGYEISNGPSNSRQLNQTEYNDKVAEVTGGIPMTGYVFYKNTKENQEKYLK